jgi:glycosyltransferase involved in cell wall biosynthesis
MHLPSLKRGKSTERRTTRVVHLVGQLDVGGMEKLLVEFARHADRKEFDLHFLCLGNRGPIADEIEQLGWPVTALEMKGLSLGLYLRLAKRLRRMQADAVHTHNTRPLIVGGLSARLAGVSRVIHTRHGQRAVNSRRQKLAFRLASMTLNRFICVSQDSADLTAAEGVSSKRIGTIWNGIDIERFQPGRGSRGPVVAVGRLSPEKDFATLIRAAAIASRRDPSFRLEIAGDGVCMPALRDLINQLGLNDSGIRLLGPVQDIPGLLSRASAFALSSLTEGVSLAIMEAMASGLPVVATRVGGNPEVIADGVTGLLVPPSDPEALAAALLAVWQNPDERLRMGERGRSRAAEQFDVRRMIASYERLYRGDLLP